MSVLLNNSLVISRNRLADSIEKMDSVLEKMQSLYCENENKAVEIAKTVSNSIDEKTTTASDTLAALRFLSSPSPLIIHNEIINELRTHRNNVKCHDTNTLNARINECLLKTSELKTQIINIQKQSEIIRAKLFPSSFVRWAKEVLEFTNNDNFTFLTSKSIISTLFSPDVSYAKKLQRKKEKIIARMSKLNIKHIGCELNVSPEDIIQQNSNHFSELTKLLQNKHSLMLELQKTEELEDNLLLKMSGIANSKRFLNTYEHDSGIKQRLLERTCEREFTNEELVSYCSAYGSWHLVDEHTAYEAKKMFLSMKSSDLKIQLTNMKKCLALLDSLISGKLIPSSWLRLRSKRILRAFTSHTIIFDEYSESLLEACIAASTFTVYNKATDSYSCFNDITKQFTHKHIEAGNLPSALFKSLLSEAESPLCDDDLHKLLEVINEPEQTPNAQLVA